MSFYGTPERLTAFGASNFFYCYHNKNEKFLFGGLTPFFPIKNQLYKILINLAKHPFHFSLIKFSTAFIYTVHKISSICFLSTVNNCTLLLTVLYCTVYRVANELLKIYNYFILLHFLTDIHQRSTVFSAFSYTVSEEINISEKRDSLTRFRGMFFGTVG
jgi:hypothetical protein